MIPNEPVLYKNVITEEERVILKDNALFLLERGDLRINAAGAGGYRNFKSYYNVDELTELHQTVYHRIVELIGVEDPVIDPALGIIISVIKPGGFIHNHIDKYANFPEGRLKQYSSMRNVRFNVMVNRGDDISYDPHIDNKPFTVKLCDAWCFGASEIQHNTPKISGPEYRIVYQFGFMMNAI